MEEMLSWEWWRTGVKWLSALEHFSYSKSVCIVCG